MSLRHWVGAVFGIAIVAAPSTPRAFTEVTRQAGALDPVLYWRSTDTLWIYDRRPELGMNSFVYDSAHLSQLAALHSRIVRVTLEVDRYNAGAPEFAAIVNQLCTKGFIPLAVVHSADALVGTPTANYDAFASFMGRAAAKFPCVRFWQLFNEVDAGHVSSRVFGGDSVSPRAKGVRYAEMLRKAYPRIKAANARAMVITAGTADTHDDGFLRGIYDGGGRQYFDILAQHRYGAVVQDDGAPTPDCEGVTGGGMRSTLQCLKTFLQNRGDVGRMVWFTEFGWGACEYVAKPGRGQEYDANQRDFWSEMMRIADSSGIVQKMIGFTLVTPECGAAASDDARTGLGMDDHTFGLMRRDSRTPRRTFYYLRDTARYNAHIAASPTVSGSVTVAAGHRRPKGIAYSRRGDRVTFRVTVDKLVPTVIVWERDPTARD